MNTTLSNPTGPRMRYAVRVTLIALVALLPFALLAQQSASKGQLPPGTAVAIPFSGPGWQDKVLQYEGYVMPPPDLARAVLAPRDMNVTLSNPSPDKKWFLREINDGPVPMTIFGKPFDEMGGVFIDWKANRLRSVTLRNTIAIEAISAADGSHKKIATPPNTRVTNARWTPDGTGIIYMVMTDDATHLWVTDVATNKPRQITKTSLLTTFVTSFSYLGTGSAKVVAVFPPDGRTARPLPPVVPAGPEVRISMDADKNRLRTYPSLMSTPYDSQLLEWHATGQIGVVDVATGVVTKFGKPEMITAVDMNPDGKYARVTRMTKPFAYVVPVSSFGSIEEVWDNTGKSLTELSKRELNLGAAPDATPDPVVDPTNPNAQPAPAQPAAGGGGGRGGAANDNGKRELTWRADGNGFDYLQLEPAPASANAGGNGRGGGRNGGGGQGGGAGRVGAAGAGAAQQPAAPPRKDRLMQWLPPFSDSSTKQVYENDTRMTGVRFSPDGSILFFTENNNQVALYMNDLATKYVVVRGGGGGANNARGGGDPNAAAPAAGGQQAANGRGAAGDVGGTLLGVGGGGGGGGRGGGGGGGGRGGGGGGATGPVLLSPDGSSVYVQGTTGGNRGGGGRAAATGGAQAAAAPAGAAQQTYIDKVNIKTGERTRIFITDNSLSNSSGPLNETVATVLDPEMKRLVLTQQNTKTPPQQYLFDNGNRKQLTNNEDLFPDMTAMQIQRFTVTRADGFIFRTTVYLPGNYKEGTRLPGFFWFYPAEFTSQEAYDTPARGGGAGGAGGGNTFQSFGTLSKQFLVSLGYVVIENDAPIVGPQGEMNNNYVNDLRNDLSAVIDDLDRRQFIDRQRLAIGGHSYGAFSTVNAMVNTPFFKAGIAGDGAYNRTLTPLGFQNERRDLWQAPNVYLDMSPFLKANQMTGALLMYHGMHDQNVGTDPINSLRLFHALNGLGKVVALYRYPNEDHGPAARETLLDLWSRWAAWLDKYVKNPQPVVKPAPAATGGTRGGGGGR